MFDALNVIINLLLAKKKHPKTFWLITCVIIMLRSKVVGAFVNVEPNSITLKRKSCNSSCGSNSVAYLL